LTHVALSAQTVPLFVGLDNSSYLLICLAVFTLLVLEGVIATKRRFRDYWALPLLLPDHVLDVHQPVAQQVEFVCQPLDFRMRPPINIEV
jgi:hypothetical protein